MPEPHDPIRCLHGSSASYVQPQSTLRSIARRLKAEGTGALLVAEDGEPVAIVGEHDIVSALADGADPDGIWSGFSTLPEVRLAAPQDSVVDVALEMLDASIGHVLVVEEGKTVGVVNQRDVLRHLVDAALTNRARPRG